MARITRLLPALTLLVGLAAWPAEAKKPRRVKLKPAAVKKVKPGKVKLAAPAKAGKDTIRLVEYFLSVDTTDLPPEAIPQFMAVDTNTLPARLRDPYRAKRAELSSLRKITQGKTKPPLRRLGNGRP